MKNPCGRSSTPLETLRSLAARVLDTLFPPLKPIEAFACIKTPPPPPPPPEKPDGFMVGHDMNSKQPVTVLSAELDRHMLIVGGTGCGKTTLIARLFTEEIEKWQ